LITQTVTHQSGHNKPSSNTLLYNKRFGSTL
jgi:hypothetical protein